MIRNGTSEAHAIASLSARYRAGQYRLAKLLWPDALAVLADAVWHDYLSRPIGHPLWLLSELFGSPEYKSPLMEVESAWSNCKLCFAVGVKFLNATVKSGLTNRTRGSRRKHSLSFYSTSLYTLSIFHRLSLYNKFRLKLSGIQNTMGIIQNARMYNRHVWRIVWQSVSNDDASTERDVVLINARRTKES